ncbi:MAG TPA: MFS transporter [Ktedonobacterales bacterium]
MSILNTLTGRRSTSALGVSFPGITLAVIVTCQLMLVLDATVVNIALPKIQNDLGISATTASWLLNAYLLTFGGLLLLGGRIGDIFGRRRAFMGGLLLFVVSSLLGGFAQSIGMLIAMRAAQGVGSAIAAPSALSLIATNFAEGNPRNRALSVYSAVSSAGGSIGLVLGGALTAWASWRWVFFINVPIGLVVIALASRVIAEPRRNPGRLDIAGALTATLGMVSLVYGFIRAASQGWGDHMTWGSFAAAALLLGLFVFVESRVNQPLLPLRLLADRNRASAYVAIMLIPAAMFSVFFFLTQFMQNALGYSPVIAGLAFLPMTLTMFSTVRILPRLLPRFGPRPFVILGTSLMIVALAWFSQLTASSTFAASILGPELLMGLGVGCCFLPLSVIVLTGVRGEDSGAVSGAMQTMQQSGASLGVAILVTVFGSATSAAIAHPLVHTLARSSLRLQASDILAQGIESVFHTAVLFPTLALLVALFVIRTLRSNRSAANSGAESDAPNEERIPVGAFD